MEKNLFERGDVEKISSRVFNQTCHSEGAEVDEHSSYTEPLCFEEEVWLMEGFIQNPSLWSDFVKAYTAHYNLSNIAMEVLIKNISLPHAFELAEGLLSTYGYSDEQLYLLLKQQYSDEQKKQILEILCKKAGVFHQGVYAALEQFDEKYAQLYKANALKMSDFWASATKKAASA